MAISNYLWVGHNKALLSESLAALALRKARRYVKKGNYKYES